MEEQRCGSKVKKWDEKPGKPCERCGGGTKFFASERSDPFSMYAIPTTYLVWEQYAHDCIVSLGERISSLENRVDSLEEM